MQTIRLTYNENTGTASRMDDFVVETRGGTGGPDTETLELTQLAALPTLTVTPATLPTLAAAGGMADIAIDIGGGATGWVLTEAEAFIAPNMTSGSADATVSLTYNPNTTSASRMATITVMTTGERMPAITRTVTITQLVASVSTISITGANSTNVAATASTHALNVAIGNATGWETTPSGDWLRANPSSGSTTGMASINIEVDANPGRARSGYDNGEHDRGIKRLGRGSIYSKPSGCGTYAYRNHHAICFDYASCVSRCSDGQHSYWRRHRALEYNIKSILCHSY